jgi:ring-1,2-phenylacetyl-CoA epoxidase subunit PaaD
VVTEQEIVSTIERAWRLAEAVPDPELPMLTVGDLGILREVSLDDGRVTVSLTPTYSGCPAMTEICREVSARLADGGFPDALVRTVLSPPWSSDWISPDGRRKLTGAGVAPPRSPDKGGSGPVPLTLTDPGAGLACPACGSAQTRRTAAFGATACKDLYRCQACGEPFEHVKEI